MAKLSNKYIVPKLKKKFVIKYKVTNKNIHLRFKKEQEKDTEYTQKDLARDMGHFTTKKDKEGNTIPDRTIACRWVSLNKNTQRLPNKTRICPYCGKSAFQKMEEWINDGSIN